MLPSGSCIFSTRLLNDATRPSRSLSSRDKAMELMWVIVVSALSVIMDSFEEIFSRLDMNEANSSDSPLILADMPSTLAIVFSRWSRVLDTDSGSVPERSTLIEDTAVSRLSTADDTLSRRGTMPDDKDDTRSVSKFASSSAPS